MSKSRDKLERSEMRLGPTPHDIEALQRANDELRQRLGSLSRAHDDLQNLIASVEFATLFLDTGLRVRHFTPGVADLLGISAHHRGWSITDIAHRLDYAELAADARRVIEERTPAEREIRSQDGRSRLIRLRPYRAAEDEVDGVVVTLIDVTERRRVDEALRDIAADQERRRRLVELSRAPIFVWDVDGGILEWNRGSEELYGYGREEAIGRSKDELLRTMIPGSSFAAIRQEIIQRGSWSGELRHRAKDGRELVVETHIELLNEGGRRLVLESTRDVTEAKVLTARQDLLLRELTHRVKNTLAVVHSIAQQTLRNSRSLAEFGERFDGRLVALSRAHSLLFDSSWTGAELSALAHDQLEIHTTGSPRRIRLSGEPLILPADMATPFALILHELATNAAKYGSLSNDDGLVDLRWRVQIRNGQGTLFVEWQEQGGPPVTAPTHRGFGSALIERGLPNAAVKQDYRAEGYVCTIEVPLQPEARDTSGR